MQAGRLRHNRTPQLRHRPAGNCAFDGLYRYSYDAWNRLSQVARAWRDDAGALHNGSVIATMQYDGLHRRTTKVITNSGDWSNGANGMTYCYTWDENWRLLETRDGSGRTLKQHLWGARYVDDLVQIAVNTHPSSQSTCDAAYYAMQNANFNVMGLTDAAGTLVERYEYTPYGQRTVYKKAGTNDALTTAPLHDSQPVTADGQPAPYGLCDIGHQGLMHDKEFGLVYNRMRYLDSRTGRWMQRDHMTCKDGPSNAPPPGHGGLPLANRTSLRGSGWPYRDGVNLQQYVRSSPVCGLDPNGLARLQYKYIGIWVSSYGVDNDVDIANNTKATRFLENDVEDLLWKYGVNAWRTGNQMPISGMYRWPTVVTVPGLMWDTVYDFDDMENNSEWSYVDSWGRLKYGDADDIFIFVPGLLGMKGTIGCDWVATHHGIFHVTGVARALSGGGCPRGMPSRTRSFITFSAIPSTLGRKSRSMIRKASCTPGKAVGRSLGARL